VLCARTSFQQGILGAARAASCWKVSLMMVSCDHLHVHECCCCHVRTRLEAANCLVCYWCCHAVSKSGRGSSNRTAYRTSAMALSLDMPQLLVVACGAVPLGSHSRVNCSTFSGLRYTHKANKELALLYYCCLHSTSLSCTESWRIRTFFMLDLYYYIRDALQTANIHIHTVAKQQHRSMND